MTRFQRVSKGNMPIKLKNTGIFAIIELKYEPNEQREISAV